MYISDIDYFKKQTIVYSFISILVAVFGAVYEYFSHEVYSYYMIYAFVIPLSLGMFPSLMIALEIIKKMPNRISVNLYNAGIATITIYSIIRGILEIYGTTNSLINYYLYIAIMLIFLSIFVNCLNFENKSG